MLRITKNSLILPVLTAGMLFLFNACDDDSSTGPDPEPESQLEVHTVQDVDIDYPTGIAYYSLRENSIVDESDSASTQWDIAFSRTTIYTNSESSGPGEGGAIVLDQSFESTTTAPSTGYAIDTTSTNLAIPTGSTNGWYRYTGQTGTPPHTVLPLDNKTILIRTADGEHYAKLQILSFYEGNPEITDETPASEITGFYTFEYAIQMNGTTELN